MDQRDNDDNNNSDKVLIEVHCSYQTETLLDGSFAYFAHQSNHYRAGYEGIV